MNVIGYNNVPIDDTISIKIYLDKHLTQIQNEYVEKPLAGPSILNDISSC